MKTNFLKLIISVVIPLAVGGLGSVVTLGAIEEWYRGLAKPQLVPPDGVFGPVWTTLYILMGLSLYLVWTAKNGDKTKAYLIFGLQLLLNLGWSLVFFGLRSPFWALAEILALLGVILMNIYMFSRHSKAAAWLLVPYLGWVGFATYLTYGVWQLN